MAVTLQARMALVEAYNQNMDWKTVAVSHRVTVDTARRIINRYIKTGKDIECFVIFTDNIGKIKAGKPGGNKPTKITEDYKLVLEVEVEKHPDFTLQEYVEKMVQLGFPRVHFSSLSKTLNSMLFTMKKAYYEPAKRNAPLTKESRKEFAQWLAENYQNFHLIWVDETGLDLYLTRTRGRAKKGKKCTPVYNNQRGKHISVTMAVSAALGVVVSKIQIGGVGRDDFIGFLLDLKDQLLNHPSNKPYLVLMDNAPAHRNVEAIMEPFENIFTLKRLPIYSPQLNAIEFCFSNLKASIRHLLRVGGPVDDLRLTNETLTACRTRILTAYVEESVNRLDTHTIGQHQTYVLVKGLQEALQLKDM